MELKRDDVTIPREAIGQLEKQGLYDPERPDDLFEVLYEDRLYRIQRRYITEAD